MCVCVCARHISHNDYPCNRNLKFAKSREYNPKYVKLILTVSASRRVMTTFQTTVSNIHWKHFSLVDIDVPSAVEVFTTLCYINLHLLSYLLTYLVVFTNCIRDKGFILLNSSSSSRYDPKLEYLSSGRSLLLFLFFKMSSHSYHLIRTVAD